MVIGGTGILFTAHEGVDEDADLDPGPDPDDATEPPTDIDVSEGDCDCDCDSDIGEEEEEEEEEEKEDEEDIFDGEVINSPSSRGTLSGGVNISDELRKGFESLSPLLRRRCRTSDTVDITMLDK